MRFTKYKGALIIISLFMLAFAAPALAMDAPHNDTNNVGCVSCHSHWNDTPGSHIDESTMNYLCQSCHDPSGLGSAPAKINHTGKETKSDGIADPQHYYTENGVQQNWTLQCINCHDPHYQKQSVLYKDEIAADGAYLVTGTIAVGGVQDNYTGDTLAGPSDTVFETIVDSGTPNWIPDEWAGYSVVVGSDRLNTYRIKSNTINSLIVAVGTTNGIRTGSRYAHDGSPYHIVYGKMIRGQMLAIRPIKNGTDNTIFNASIYRDTKFFQNAGAHSSAASEADDQAICIVCHTRTAVMNVGRLWYPGTFDGIINNSHNDRASSSVSCWSNADCHKPPAEGFDGSGQECGDCHGVPPTGTSPFNLINAPDGSSGFYKTGRTTAGAHQKHKDVGFTDCATCHLGGGPSGTIPTDVHYDAVEGGNFHKITIGFEIDPLNGIYTVAAPNAPFDIVNGTGVTIVPGAPSPGECSNLYCHSDGNNTSYKTVAWDAAPLTCSGCHGSGSEFVTTGLHKDGASGLHVYGTYNYACYECHSTTVNSSNAIITAGKQHVDNTKDVSFGNIASGGSWVGGTLTCSVYCHTDGQGTPMAPKWNDVVTGPGACGVCHDVGGGGSSLSGAHAAHTTGLYVCQDCHSLTAAGNSTVISTTYHINQLQDIDILAANGGDGSDYQAGTEKCSTTYCHGTLSPAWTATPTYACGKCHGLAGGASTADSAPGAGGTGLDTNGDSAATDAQVGAHRAHMEAVEGMTNPISCNECHIVPGTVTSAGHIDDNVPAEVPMSGTLATTGGASPSYSAGTCSNVYCHDTSYTTSGYGGGSGTTPAWNATTYFQAGDPVATKCGLCHGFPPPPGHPAGTTCSGCHGTVVDASYNIINTNLHINGTVEGGGCTGCHAQPPYDANTIVNSAASYGPTGRGTTFSGTAQGGHVGHSDAGIIDCLTCHNGGGDTGQHNSASPTYVNIGFDIFGATTGYYSAPDFTDPDYDLQAGGTTTVNVGGSTRTCTNIYCHSDGGDYAGTKTYGTGNWDDVTYTYPADCNKCHNDGGSGYVDNNAHPKHISTYGYECVDCHADTVDAGMNLIGNHVNNAKDVAFSGLASSGGYTRPSCSNVYCHSDGGDYAGTVTYTTPAWNDATVPLGCNECHNNGGAGFVDNNAHPVHVSTYSLGCDECHVQTVNNVPAIINTTIHSDGAKDVFFKSGGSYARPTCSNVYCHSDGKGGAPQTAAAWTGTGYGCTACHDTGGVSTVLSGAHKAHTDGAPVTYGCADCHTDTVSNNTTISNPAKHVDTVQDVAISASFGGDGLDYQVGSETCLTTYCHGTASPAWTAAPSYACGKCHGIGSGSVLADSAPGASGTGIDTNGDTAATDPQVGAHRVHLEAMSAITTVVACDECHTVPGTTTAAGHIDSALPAEVPTDGTRATAGSATAGGTVYSAGTCSNVYCHDVQFTGKGMGGGTNTTPSWNDTTFYEIPANLTDAQTYCARCHGYPPAGAHPADLNCGGCHGTVVDDITNDWTILNTSLHINGSVEGGGCTGCHDQPPYDAQTIVNAAAPYGFTGRSTTFSGTAQGGHVGHASAGITDCGTCHRGGQSTGGQHNSATPTYVNMGFNIFSTLGGYYSAPDFTNANYDLQSDGSTTVNVGGSTRTCTNIYCHSDGGDYLGTKTYGTGNWDDVTYSYPTDCNKCHNDGGSGYVDNNAHPDHVTLYSFACVDCHADTVDAGMNIIGNHVNNAKDVAFGGSGLGAGGSYTRPNCSNVYCHSSGESTPSYSAAAWNAGSYGCSACHNSGTAMATGKHQAHVNGAASIGNNFACSDCHIGTLDSDTTIGASKIANHVNGTRNVIFNSTYGGSWASPNCSNTYCHSDGNTDGTVHYQNPAWNGAATDCTSCHASGAVAYPDYANGGAGSGNSNSHLVHVGTNSISCSECHSQTTADGTTINGSDPTKHINKAVEVNMAPGSIDGSEVCSNTYCHGNFTGGTTATPQWGGTAACGTCHKYTAADPPTKNAHARHAGNGAGQLNLACSSCHGAGAGGSGHVDSNVTWDVTALVGATPNYNSLPSGGRGLPSATVYSCSNVYCHSTVQATDGSGAPTYTNQSWSAASVACSGCHADPMTAGSHTRHVTTWSYACSVCHNGHGDETATHADGTINMSFSATAGASAAYSDPTNLPQDGFNNCTNTRCHGSTSDNWGTNNTTYDVCTTCHGRKLAVATQADYAPGAAGTGVDTGGGFAATDQQVGAHRVHLEGTDNISSAVACNECHVVPASVTSAGHIDSDLPAEVNPDGPRATAGSATAGTTTYTQATRTCANVYCHDSSLSTSGYGGGSDTTPTWEVDTYFTTPTNLATAQTNCGKCHGYPPAGAHPADNNCGACHGTVINDAVNDWTFLDKTLHIDGTVQGGGTCTGCHNGTQSDGTNADIDSDGVRAIVPEFSRNSHHVVNQAIDVTHCATCHGEGNSAGDTTALHKNGQIDLRDVDSATATFTWTGTEHTNVDKHCMSCHDADGASVVHYAPGSTAAFPFGGSVTTNNYDQMDRGGVFDIVTISDTGSYPWPNDNDSTLPPGFNGNNYDGAASQHNILGPRYFGTLLKDAQYEVSKNNFTPLMIGSNLDGTAMADNVRLHCGDCHTNGQWETNGRGGAGYPNGGVGAHGSHNEYLLRTAEVNPDNVSATGQDTIHLINQVVCFNCHSYLVYGNLEHAPGNGQDKSHSATTDGVTSLIGIAGRVTNYNSGKGLIVGQNCANCHNTGATGWGGLHGGDTTYTAGNSTQQTTYRFLPGMNNDKYVPNSGWTTSNRGTCYTSGANAATWAGCSQHTGGKAAGNTSGVARPLNY